MSNELWSLCVSNHELRWQQINAAGQAPAARSGHVACALPPTAHAGGSKGFMLVCAGRGAAGRCLADIHLLSIAAMAWSKPKVEGCVPQPVWAAASCVLPRGGPLDCRVLIDGGR